MPLMESVHSEGAIPPERNILLLMTSLSVCWSRLWVWIVHLLSVCVLIQLLHYRWHGMGLRWSSRYCNVWGGDLSHRCSLHLRRQQHNPRSWTGTLPPRERSLLPLPMLLVLVVVPLPTRWGIPWLPQVGDTRHPLWACTTFPSPLAAIGD